MGFFNSLFNKNRDGGFKYRLVLDIGTEYLKAVMVEFDNTEKNIIGFGRVKQDYGNMDGGAITNIQGVSTRARESYEKCRDYTPHQADEVICGIAGEFVKGVLISIDNSREKPDKKISKQELNDLIEEGRKKAYKTAVKKAEMETGINDIKLEMIQYSLVEVKVDGYRVNDPYQFQGNNISLSIFYTFAPLVQLGALRTIAANLGCKLKSVVAEPLSIAYGIMSDESYEFGAIIIDIGGGTTDIALIRDGGIEGTQMFAMGGRAFTRSLASRMNLTLKEAEELKLSYSAGEKVKDYNMIDKIVKSNLHLLYQGIELSLIELARGEILPKYIYFCGGGSGMKGLISGFKEINLQEKVPFGQTPIIKQLTGKDIKGIKDENQLLVGVEHTTPCSLAYFSTDSISPMSSYNYNQGFGQLVK